MLHAENPGDQSCIHELSYSKTILNYHTSPCISHGCLPTLLSRNRSNSYHMKRTYCSDEPPCTESASARSGSNRPCATRQRPEPVPGNALCLLGPMRQPICGRSCYSEGYDWLLSERGLGWLGFHAQIMIPMGRYCRDRLASRPLTARL